jgi:hypothetical protein
MTGQWKPKIGDQVEIVFNESLGYHPTIDRELQPGDIITIVDFDAEVVIYEVNHGNGVFTNEMTYAEIKPLSHVGEIGQCTCDIISLMNKGCCCGFLEREKKNMHIL